MKVSLFSKAFVPVRHRRYQSTGHSVSGIAFSIVKEKKLNFLNSFLVTKSDKGNSLKSRLDYHESRIIDAYDRKTQLSNELLIGEQKWKDKLAEAQKNKDIAASNYFYNLLDLKLKVSQVEKTVQELITTSKSSGIPFSISFYKRALDKVEEQKVVLGTLEATLRKATDELNSMQEKPSEMRSLIARFQSARSDHRVAVADFHTVKASLDKFSKDTSQIKQMIEHMTNTEKQGLSQIISYKFWTNVAKMLVISLRH